MNTGESARTDHASLRSVGVLTNRPLLAGIAAALAFAAAMVYLPLMHAIFGTEALTLAQLAIMAPFPFIVWGADEIRRWLLRRHRRPGRQHQHRPKVLQRHDRYLCQARLAGPETDSARPAARAAGCRHEAPMAHSHSTRSGRVR